jgi:hypothetical protein
VAACTAAEFVGMTAAAGMAVLTAHLVGEPTTPGAAVVVMAGALLGGGVEGFALGELQFRVLRTWLPTLSHSGYVGATVALAVAFWFIGMLPSTLMSLTGAGTTAQADVTEPPLLLVALAAAAGGAVGGAAFGLVQGWALRGHVRHPWRWIRPNAVGWGIAVCLITVVASAAPAGAPVAVTVGLGLAVGLAAGACVGVVTGQALPALDLALPWWNRVVADLLLSPLHRALSRGVMLLRFRGRRSGVAITLPVQYATVDLTTLVVYVARPETKLWWRSFTDGDRVLAVRLRGTSRTGTGRVLTSADTGFDVAAAAYRTRWPKVRLTPDVTMVLVRLH